MPTHIHTRTHTHALSLFISLSLSVFLSFSLPSSGLSLPPSLLLERSLARSLALSVCLSPSFSLKDGHRRPLVARRSPTVLLICAMPVFFQLIVIFAVGVGNNGWQLTCIASKTMSTDAAAEVAPACAVEFAGATSHVKIAATCGRKATQGSTIGIAPCTSTWRRGTSFQDHATQMNSKRPQRDAGVMEPSHLRRHRGPNGQ